jgi:hypothetical protein
LIERADADARDLGDARRRRGVEALALENLNGRLEDGVHRGLRARLPWLFSCGLGRLLGHGSKPEGNANGPAAGRDGY